MGKGNRHGRNQNCSAVFSYHEREKYKKQSGYGSINERLGADAIKEFDACSITMQTCREPLVSPDGHVFDKESILEYILKQKKELKRRMEVLMMLCRNQNIGVLLQLWEKEQQDDENEREAEQQRKEEENLQKFEKYESTPARIGSFKTYEKGMH